MSISESKFCTILTVLFVSAEFFSIRLSSGQTSSQYCKICVYGQAVTTLFCFSSSFMSFSATQQ